ncbi:MAG: DUF6504 family protein [Ornithinimicrobium sp.]
MSRQYHEQIEVQCDDVLLGRLQASAEQHAPAGSRVPTAFMWRGRVHVVRAVVAAWTQRTPWWRLGEVDTASPRGLEQRVWRVEASIGPHLLTGVYDLTSDDLTSDDPTCGDPTRAALTRSDVARSDVARSDVTRSERWRLLRVAD